MNFPSAEETLSQMLDACRDPHSVARVKLEEGAPWQDMSGPKLLRHLEGEVRGLTIDYVKVPG